MPAIGHKSLSKTATRHLCLQTPITKPNLDRPPPRSPPKEKPRQTVFLSRTPFCTAIQAYGRAVHRKLAAFSYRLQRNAAFNHENERKLDAIARIRDQSRQDGNCTSIQ